MLLFPQKDDAKSAQNEKAFYVLSSRKVINEELSQLLRLAGFNQVSGGFNGYIRLEWFDDDFPNRNFFRNLIACSQCDDLYGYLW